jgi:hypothetical protein
VVEHEDGGRWWQRPRAVWRRRGRHHLARWWISGDDGDEVRVMALGCQGGAAPVRLEGAQGVAARLGGAGGGGLPETSGKEVGGSNETTSLDT